MGKMFKLVGLLLFSLLAAAGPKARDLKISSQARQTFPNKIEKIEGTVLSIKDAKFVQKWAASHPEMPWRHAENGCNVRAYHLNQLLEAQGILSAKIFATVENSSEFLLVDNPYISPEKTKTQFHTAAAILVEVKKGVIVPRILDATMFPDRLVSEEEWLSALTQHRPKMRVKSFYASRFQLTAGNGNLTSYLQMYDDNVKKNLAHDMSIHNSRLPKAPPSRPMSEGIQ